MCDVVIVFLAGVVPPNILLYCGLLCCRFVLPGLVWVVGWVVGWCYYFGLGLLFCWLISVVLVAVTVLRLGCFRLCFGFVGCL